MHQSCYRVIFTTIYRVLVYSHFMQLHKFAGSMFNNYVFVLYSFLDNRYRTTLLSFHLNRNLISKVSSLLLFTLFCITYLRRREMNPIAFLFQFYTVPDVYNVKCIHFKWAVFCIIFLPASHYKTDLIQTINYTALQLSRMKFN